MLLLGIRTRQGTDGARDETEMRAHANADLGPLELRDGRLRLRPGVDLERWALAEARRRVLEGLRGHAVRVWLFGSRARGDARPGADIDIALEAADGRPLPKALVGELRERLEESLIPWSVDLVDLAEAGSRLREAVHREGVPWT